MLNIASILVVCDGTHCRSPLAEALLRQILPARIRVESAGLTALGGMPADPEAQRLLAARGLDLSHHRGRQLTPAMALAADLILVMDERQKEDCQQLAPSVRGRVFLLGHWRAPSGSSLPDPYGRDPVFFQQTLEHIIQSIGDWLPYLIQEKGLHEQRAID